MMMSTCFRQIVTLSLPYSFIHSNTVPGALLSCEVPGSRRAAGWATTALHRAASSRGEGAVFLSQLLLFVSHSFLLLALAKLLLIFAYLFVFGTVYKEKRGVYFAKVNQGRHYLSWPGNELVI